MYLKIQIKILLKYDFKSWKYYEQLKLKMKVLCIALT